MRTTQPLNRPPFEQWAKELKVSSKYITTHLRDLVSLDDHINHNRYLKGIKSNGKIKNYGSG